MSLEIVIYPEAAFQDARGKILNILDDTRIRHVAWISSTAGAIRANHLHPPTIGDDGATGEQWMYLLSGRYWTVACPVDVHGRFVGQPEVELVKTGGLVFTPPLVGHAQWFPEDSAFLNVDAVTREHAGFGITHTFPLPVKLIEMWGHDRDGTRISRVDEDGAGVKFVDVPNKCPGPVHVSRVLDSNQPDEPLLPGGRVLEYRCLVCTGIFRHVR